MLKANKNINNVRPTEGWTGWEYPGRGYKFMDEYDTLTDLYRHVRQFEKANKIVPMEDLADVLEDHFCRVSKRFGQFCSEAVVETSTLGKIRRVISGGKAVVAMKVKSLKRELKVLPLSEVKENVDVCLKCPLNRYSESFGHEGLYSNDLKLAYGVEDLSSVEQEGHEGLGRCEACTCLLSSKVFLDVENYGDALLGNYHDINRMLQGSEKCWQLKALFHPEHLDEIIKRGAVNKQMLKDWGYI